MQPSDLSDDLFRQLFNPSQVNMQGDNGQGISNGFSSIPLQAIQPKNNLLGGIFGGTGADGKGQSMFGQIAGPATSLISSLLAYNQGQKQLNELKKNNAFQRDFASTQLNNEVAVNNERAGTRQQTRDLSSNPFARTDAAAQDASRARGVKQLGISGI